MESSHVAVYACKCMKCIGAFDIKMLTIYGISWRVYGVGHKEFAVTNMCLCPHKPEKHCE